MTNILIQVWLLALCWFAMWTTDISKSSNRTFTLLACCLLTSWTVVTIFNLDMSFTFFALITMALICKYQKDKVDSSSRDCFYYVLIGTIALLNAASIIIQGLF